MDSAKQFSLAELSSTCIPTPNEDFERLKIKSQEIQQKFNNTAATDFRGRLELCHQWFSPLSAQKVYVKPRFCCAVGVNIIFGDNAWLNANCYIMDYAPVVIGKNFMAGPGVHIYSGVSRPSRKVADERDTDPGMTLSKPVTIGNDVWIGGMSVIYPGITLGNGVVVGAKSVVTEDVPDFVVVAGNPAKVIRRLERPEEYCDK